jgi:hypothetical protein
VDAVCCKVILVCACVQQVCCVACVVTRQRLVHLGQAGFGTAGGLVLLLRVLDGLPAVMPTVLLSACRLLHSLPTTAFGKVHRSARGTDAYCHGLPSPV